MAGAQPSPATPPPSPAASIRAVDSRNLAELRPTFEAAFKQATFLALSCEYTGQHGLGLGGGTRGSAVLQAPRSRYSQIRQALLGGAHFCGKCDNCHCDLIEGANFCHSCGSRQKHGHRREKETVARQQDFLICQVGIACFQKTEGNRWAVQCFRFSISPRPQQLPGGPRQIPLAYDIRFGALGSGIQCLSDSSFDFNRWVSDGLPCISRSILRQEQEPKHKRHKGHFDKKLVVSADSFLGIWDALLSSGKPVVGHECLMDILYLCHQLEGTLSQQLLQAFSSVTKRVKVWVDTKHMLTWYPRNLYLAFRRTRDELRQKLRQLKIASKLYHMKRELSNKERQRKEQRQETAGGPPQSPAEPGAPARTPGIATPVSPAPGTPQTSWDDSGTERIAQELRDTKIQVYRRQLGRLRLLRRALGAPAEGPERKDGERCDDSEEDDDADSQDRARPLRGNLFHTMSLSELHDMVQPFLVEMLPGMPRAVGPDAGYSAYMGGCVFLALFNIIHGKAADADSAKSGALPITPSNQILMDIHCRPPDTGARYSNPERGDPREFAFANRLYLPAAPFFLDMTAKKVLDPQASHSHTFVVDLPAEGERGDDRVITQLVRGVDPFAELQLLVSAKDGSRSLVVVMTGIGMGRTVGQADAEEVLRELQASLDALKLTVHRVREMAVARPKPALPPAAGRGTPLSPVGAPPPPLAAARAAPVPPPRLPAADPGAAPGGQPRPPLQRAQQRPSSPRTLPPGVPALLAPNTLGPPPLPKRRIAAPAPGTQPLRKRVLRRAPAAAEQPQLGSSAEPPAKRPRLAAAPAR
eukprot:TRINITY_DN11047_c0_g1_i1.p1 TRINITY_DN11047_c0_g1~~TRINITY_DN11047_c0_g1_i1.p1  ORF type:complete len:856 (+),score=287.15 TRINITY_DN11047_c0_g1_i1:131-2569(+)